MLGRGCDIVMHELAIAGHQLQVNHGELGPENIGENA